MTTVMNQPSFIQYSPFSPIFPVPALRTEHMFLFHLIPTLRALPDPGAGNITVGRRNLCLLGWLLRRLLLLGLRLVELLFLVIGLLRKLLCLWLRLWKHSRHLHLLGWWLLRLLHLLLLLRECRRWLLWLSGRSRFFNLFLLFRSPVSGSSGSDDHDRKEDTCVTDEGQGSVGLHEKVGYCVVAGGGGGVFEKENFITLSGCHEIFPIV